MIFAKKFRNILFFISPIILLSPTILSCSKYDKDTTYLRILNSEDYIYKYDEKEAKKGGNNKPDLTVQFEQYMANKGKKVKVIYDTFDTMENMFNTLKTGKTKYDLVCASEYMMQKLARLDLIIPLNHDNIPNYKNNCSPFIKNKLKAISAKGDDKTLDDYGVCYMWGTLGIIYNPKYETFIDRGYSENEVHEDMKSWDSLWGETNNYKYKKTISIKDSMRDTYSVGLIHTYKNELVAAGSDLNARQKIFDYGGENDEKYVEHINAIKKELLKLRNNIFGFEVDSGKDDIVTGKIGIDTAWSGDAVKSMNNGDDTKVNVKLYYSIPDIGTNLWFDCWTMQKNANVEISNEFLDFISNPVNAIQNMDYIGYTSSIASNDTFNYFNDKYKGGLTQYNLNYFFQRDGKTHNYILKVPEDLTKRQLNAQFPQSDAVSKLMIMKDYGKNNDLILKMWEEVKHESLPTWAIILFSIEIIFIVGGISTLIIIKTRNKRRRKERRLINEI